MRQLFLLLVWIVMAARLSAQAAAPVMKAAETITAADVSRHVGVIAADSMQGRRTPSRGLERTAQYIADQFAKLGLKPGGDNRTWLQRRLLERRIDFAQSRVVFTARGKEAAASFTSTAYLAAQELPEQLASTGMVLLAGRHTYQSLVQAGKQADLRDKVVLYVERAGVDSASGRRMRQTLAMLTPGLVILNNSDSASFAKQLQTALQTPTASVGANWTVHVWPAAVQAVLTAGGVDLAQVRADTAPVVRALPQLTARLEIKGEAVSAPNVVGILEGSDPKLKDESVVFSAHMDHVGVGRGLGAEQFRPGPPQPPDDSIYNGADDNASGTAGIIELAEAFSQPGARPRRSMIFLTVSGEETGMLGSEHFVEHPPVPLQQIVADFNLDMIGRNWKDTVVVIGKKQSDLGATIDRVAAAHPELKMVPINDIWPQEGFYSRSDHIQFARRGVPILFFFSGVHDDYHRVTDTPEKIDAEKEARILRLVFYLGQEVGNADHRPKWNEESYRKIMKKKYQP